MNYREVVDDMRDECQTAEDTGLFNTILFNYDGWLNGEKLRVTAQMERLNPVLYRGWMMKPEEYQNLYVELEIRAIHLLTNPEAYANMHLFPNVYPVIKEDTAEMMCFLDGKFDVEMVKQHFNRFMVKDSVKSTKGTEFPAFFNQYANHPAYYENFHFQQKPTEPTITETVSRQEAQQVGDKTEYHQVSTVIAKANPARHHERNPVELIPANIPDTIGDECHAADDVPLNAEGPGSEYFNGVMDNTEVFFGIMRALGMDATKTAK